MAGRRKALAAPAVNLILTASRKDKAFHARLKDGLRTAQKGPRAECKSEMGSK